MKPHTNMTNMNIGKYAKNTIVNITKNINASVFMLLNEKMKEENKTSPQKNIREERKKKGILSVYQYSNGTLRDIPFTRAILLAFYVKEKSFQQSTSLSTRHPFGKILKRGVACWLDYSNILSLSYPSIKSSTL